MNECTITFAMGRRYNLSNASQCQCGCGHKIDFSCQCTCVCLLTVWHQQKLWQTWGKWSLQKRAGGQAALQEASSVSYCIHNFFLSSGSKWWFGKTEEDAALHTAPCAGNLWYKKPLKFHFQKSHGKNIFVLARSCVSGETAVLLQSCAKNTSSCKAKEY